MCARTRAWLRPVVDFLSPLQGLPASHSPTHGLRPFDKIRASCGLHFHRRFAAYEHLASLSGLCAPSHACVIEITQGLRLSEYMALVTYIPHCFRLIVRALMDSQ